MNFENYSVGLVITQGGLNDRQLAYFRAHLKQVARMVGGPFNLVVPVVLMHGGPRKSDSQGEARTRTLLKPLRERMDWLRVEFFVAVEIEALVGRLRTMDEVWCATSKTHGSEWCSRPGQVYQRAQGLREAPRFKMLNYWIELPPHMLPTRDRGTAKKPALKG